MKKFRKVLDGLTTSSSGNAGGAPLASSTASIPTTARTPSEIQVQETLVSENFQICKTVRHGFPHQPTSLAFDPVQKVLAIGSCTGDWDSLVLTAIANIRVPVLSMNYGSSLTRITFCHMPLWSKWMYVGTERGNTHIINVESFVLSGYVIMWNKAIELSTKTHPGPVIHLSDSPRDAGRLLIGFERGTVVMWNLCVKKADFRFYYTEFSDWLRWMDVEVKSDPATSLGLCGVRAESEDQRGEPFVIFSGGLAYDKAGRRPTLTIMHGKAITNPYPMGLHESPVTCTAYFADCSPDLIPALYSMGTKHKKQGYTTKMLYKLKSCKVFEKPKAGEGWGAELVEQDPYAVQMVSWCQQSRLLCVAGISAHVILYRFSRQEATIEITAMEIGLQRDVEGTLTPSETDSSAGRSHPPGSPQNIPDNITCLRVDGEPPEQITSLELNSAYGLLALGNCNGLAVVDFLQKSVVLCMSTLELVRMRGLYNFHSHSKKRIRTSCQVPLTEPQDIAEPMTNLKASQYSPVFHLLDNVRAPGRKLSLPTDLKTGLDHVSGPCTSPSSQPCVSGKPSPLGAQGARLNRRGPGKPPFRKAQSAACMEISLPASLVEECREKSFSHSRSSSVSSIERETKEAVTMLSFMESYAHKTDSAPTACLWVGTSLGVALPLTLSIPAQEDDRLDEPVTVVPGGSVLMLKGSVLALGWLDCGGALMSSPYEVWRDPHASAESDRPRMRKLVNLWVSGSQDAGAEGQLAVVCSEIQAKVFLLPAQTCLYMHNITESSIVLRADILSVCNSVCLACFCANGHVLALSLPSLRPLLDVKYLPLTDERIARTFCFSHSSQALYLSSPTELQRLTCSQEMCDNLQELLGELFTPVETPEAQTRGFLKSFFGGNTQTFNREELFGEAAAGKASQSLAQHIPGQGGMEGMKAAAGGVVGDLARARIALDERGQRLGELEERTALMMSSAEMFSKHAHK
ncbi:hypothetical protein JZ751_020252, partial [Albula glossodonta]